MSVVADLFRNSLGLHVVLLYDLPVVQVGLVDFPGAQRRIVRPTDEVGFAWDIRKAGHATGMGQKSGYHRSGVVPSHFSAVFMQELSLVT